MGHELVMGMEYDIRIFSYAGGGGGLTQKCRTCMGWGGVFSGPKTQK